MTRAPALQALNRILGMAVLLALAALCPPLTQAAPQGAILSGIVKSQSGQPMSGVAVSVREQGKTFSTTVFTDEQGAYYFPPMESGKYLLWTNAVGYKTGHGEVALEGSVRHQDVTLEPLPDFFKQLTQDRLFAGMPEDTPEHRKMKDVLVNDCTSCHPVNYILQNKFDKQGWSAAIYLMARLTLPDMYFGGVDQAPFPQFEYFRDELSTFLAEMRGPGPSPMHVTPGPRPSGEGARAVITEYDVPDPDRTDQPESRGDDWSLGTPTSLNGARGIHDGQEDFLGNIWFIQSEPSLARSYGKVNLATGEVTNYALPGRNGIAAYGHVMARDKDGNIWFNLYPTKPGAPGDLARLDPASGKAELFTPPDGMHIAGSVDIDGKGGVWTASPTGAIHFDPQSKTFRDFKSLTLVSPEGGPATYGVAGDQDGNGWWSEIDLDIVGKGDVETGKSSEVKLPPRPSRAENDWSADDRKLFELSGTQAPRFTTPGRQAPRRMAADGDNLWVCDYNGDNLARIDIHTLKYTLIPIPIKDAGCYGVAVDQHHNVYMTVINADSVLEYHPDTGQFAIFRMPSLGAGMRDVSVLDRDGVTSVIMTYSRTGRVARMVVRTPEQLQALKSKVGEASAAQR